MRPDVIGRVVYEIHPQAVVVAVETLCGRRCGDVGVVVDAPAGGLGQVEQRGAAVRRTGQVDQEERRGLLLLHREGGELDREERGRGYLYYVI